MKCPPIPRAKAYDLYWYFAAERQRIFERRLLGHDPPWTADKILQTFKFCNVFRATDRVSQFLIRDVAYDSHRCTPEDRVFQIVAFRTFSRIATWRTLLELLGRPPTLQDLATGQFGRALDRVRQLNGGLYTAAFILCAANPYGESSKHRNHVRLFQHMFLNDRLGGHLLRAPTLADVYSLLRGYPLVGDFMAYQYAIDINYAEYTQHSENDFTRSGPGALRGMKKVFESLGDYSPDEVVHWMVDRQGMEFQRLRRPFRGLWGRPLHAIDCQGLFCETDKYCREAMPELSSERRRIKQRFVASPEPVRLFFPPKWQIAIRQGRQPMALESEYGSRGTARAAVQMTFAQAQLPDVTRRDAAGLVCCLINDVTFGNGN